MKTFLMLLCFTLTAHAENRFWKWSVVAMASANVADAVSTVGAYETNPVLGIGPFGGRAIGIKIGIASGIVLAEYLIHRKYPEATRPMAFANCATAGALSVIAFRNIIVR